MSQTDKPSRNEDEYFAQREQEILRQQRVNAAAAASAAERRSHHMKCPKDGYDLITQTLRDVQVDTCAHCGGIWLDAGELERLGSQGEPGMVGRLLRDLGGTLHLTRRPGGSANPAS